MWPVDLFPGKVEVEVTSADREGLLRRLEASGITIYHVEDAGSIDLKFLVDRQRLNELRSVVQSRGDKLRVRWERGAYRILSGWIRRPVLMIGTVILLLLTLYLPTRILIVEVEGAVRIPERRILWEASHCGLLCGTKRHEVRSEQVKNKLLQAMPELQWIGVNTYGCRAVISVKERAIQDQPSERKGVGHIVSVCDGTVSDITVTKGTGMCAPGDAVTMGQVLISGYSDRGLFVRGEMAEGEVYGKTERTVTALFPESTTKKTAANETEKSICLILGKKRIFFSKGSGISDVTCGKMYSEYYLTLPGGIRIPVGIGVEKITDPALQERPVTPEEAEAIMAERAEAHLTDHMISGTILSRQERCENTGGVYSLFGRYICNELIGITHIEENLDRYEADRTDRERG